MSVQMRESDRVDSINSMGYSHRNILSPGIFLLDENDIVRFCNESLLRRIEISFETICGQSISRFIPDFPAYAVAYDVGDNVGTPADKPRMAQLQSLKGNVAIVRLTIVPFFKNGKSSRVVVIEEIDPRVGETGYRDIVSLMANSESNIDSVLITDCLGKIEFVNRAFESMTGFTRKELIGKSIQDEQLGLSDAYGKSKFWETVQSGKSFNALRVQRRKDGSKFHHEQSVRPFVEVTGVVTHVIFTGHDVSQRVNAMQSLARQANYDNLTGLPNRNLLSDRLRQVVKHAERSRQGFVVAMLDVDGFKAVNDSYGHSFGDSMLCKVARRVESCIRKEDTLGRLGGDEFVLILPGIDRREDAEELINKISQSFLDGFFINEKMVNVSVSIGLAIYPFDGNDLQNLMDFADKEMYRDKGKLISKPSVGLSN